ncbi:hypothetical protein [Paraburkholderia bannensis]|uniref:hypothetical protein n=1 Tax=Paraburkholderia bannensis TaxID=765414 RepID=UPI002AC365FD|nr:hypothetical protein [Paraburkholderia bannensis]
MEPGEYALRERPVRVSVESTLFSSDAGVAGEDSERTAEDVNLLLMHLWDELDECIDVEKGFGFSVLGTMSERLLAKFQSAPSRSTAALAAVMRLRRAHNALRARSYMLAEGFLGSAGQLAKDFFLQTLRELSASHRDLASRRALARATHMRVRPNSGLTAETGSAAAIAKRMNPLGAPPRLV